MRKALQPPAVPTPQTSYSQAVLASGSETLYISGQVPVDAAGQLVGKDDFRTQAHQVFRNLEANLAAGGASWTDVVKLTVFLTDMAHFPIFNEVRQEYLQPPFPAATTVAVSALVSPDWLVEIEAIAVPEILGEAIVAAVSRLIGKKPTPEVNMMAGYHYFDDEDLQAVKAVLDRGNLCSIGAGTQSELFEQEFAAEFGSPYGLTVVNAMAGLHVAVGASGAGAGSEVVCDSLVVFGALAAMYHNAVPVFADVDLETQQMDPASFEACISERTKAVIVTHWCGLMADLDPIREIAAKHGILVIEDCSHAIYAKYDGKYAGTVGDVGAFSFQQSKQMALGDGGMTIMRDPAVREHMYDMTTFGTCPKLLSWNYRMNEVVAAIGRVQLKRARSYVDICIENAGLLNEAVRGFEAIVKPQVNPNPARYEHAYHIWAARFEGDRVGVSHEAFQQACADKGIAMNFGYIGAPAYKQDTIREQIGYGRDCPRGCPLALRHPDYTQDLCPNAEYLMPRIMLSGTGGDRAGHAANAEKLREVLESFS